MSLESAARSLARSHALSDLKPGPIPSLAGLTAVPAWLSRAEVMLAEKAAETTAVEWLTDNAYVIERTLRQIAEDLPQGFYLRLPALAHGDETAAPRVHALATAIVRVTTLQLEAGSITRFVSDYQKVQTLQLAELWALPTMLRLGCLEMLVQAVERLVPQLKAPFAIGESERIPSLLDDTECVARSIRGLVTLSSIPWQRFVEQTSAIDSALRQDPCGAYSGMDAETRDRYRRAVEELARGSHHEEAAIALRATAFAQSSEAGSRAAHVGFSLVAEGRRQLEHSIRYRPGWAEVGRRWLRRHATGAYLGALTLMSALFVAVPSAYLADVGANLATRLVALGLLLLPASMLAFTVVHWSVSRIFPPSVLPKLSFEKGIPASFKTAITIPSLLGSSRDVEALLDQIERHYVSNRDPNLRFILLTGFPEADVQSRPEDAVALRAAVEGIRELNRRHGRGFTGPFHLLLRERSFNPVEDRWIGWERKRGKLDQLNRLLLGEGDAFDVHEGERSALQGIRFVITLDSDTVLPQGAAARLVGTLAHPLNRPEFDPTSGRVRAGYTVVQPRIETSPESGNRSLFTRLYCGDTAIDIYSRAVSDVYQDLFGTGIYVGKAIYDVAAFSRSLAGRVPENAIASHDLFEGIHGRAALATDIVLYEDYPPSYLAFTRRLHRWVRGDWQLVPWLGRRVPGDRHDYLPNRFAAIDRWKVLDNLRRSLLAPALLLLLVSGWTWLPGQPLVWTAFAILAPAGHLFVDFATGMVRERWRLSPDASRTLVEDVGRWLLLLAFLPYHAAVATDAIVRTLIRVLITKRHLLEWTTAANAAAAVARRNPILLYWLEMAAAPLIAVALGAALLVGRPLGAWLPALPLLLAWFLSPEIARRLSQSRPSRGETLEPADVPFLRALARRTWLFFESFVGPDGHWLPPDNYQEDPGHDVAHRTSPTNIGMLLLSTLSANDLGYIGVEEMALRIRNTLRTIAQLEHYRGHLLNWYHTRTLEHLAPRYVSTVDSGNLAGALFTVEVGCLEKLAQPCLRAERWRGLGDTIGLLEESLSKVFTAGDSAERTTFDRHVASMQEIVLDAQDASQIGWSAALVSIEAPCVELERLLIEAVASDRLAVDLEAVRTARLSLSGVRDHAHDFRHEIDSLAPWLPVLESAPDLREGDPCPPGFESLQAQIAEMLSPTVPLNSIGPLCEEVSNAITSWREKSNATCRTEPVSEELTRWIERLEEVLTSGARNARSMVDELRTVAREAEAEALGMDFGLLYDASVRHLFIGYNVSADQMDPHHYDLLASEARLASFVAIAKGDVPVEHWFSLGRPLASMQGGIGLLSWGGTMFEYLMPPLLVHSYAGTLLGESQRTAIEEQMAEGARHGLPWGVSESGFAAFDADHNYQYRAFGVPGLGRKRGLDEDRVVAPYATALALPFVPRDAVRNLRWLCDLGMLGNFGLYEAIDFTPQRLPEGQDHAIVRSYMAHHQGMTLAALDNLLCGDVLVRRFEENALVQAAVLLLQERVPARVPVEGPRTKLPELRRLPSEVLPALFPWRPDTAGAQPSVHVLGNGRMATRVSDTGSGALRWRNHALTRFVPDATLDDSGLWIYVRDNESGEIWSIGRQPTGAEEAECDVVFHAHMVELHRRENGISLRTDIAVGSAEDIEVRRITIVNESDRPRALSFTSYGEVVLAPPREDARHPAFSKLFVESRYVAPLKGLSFRRSARDPGEQPPILLHRLVADSASVVNAGFETDRARFLGRAGSSRRPLALEVPLTGSEGHTLDPIMALRADVTLAPYATEQLAFVTIAGASQPAVSKTAARFETLASFEWLLSDAQAEATREAARLGLAPNRLPQLQALLSWMLTPRSLLRASTTQVADNRLGQGGLWALGISGDYPILLFDMARAERSELLADLVRAHQLWAKRGMPIDLVVVSRVASGYLDEAWDQVHRLLEEFGAAQWLDRAAGIHLIRSDQVTPSQLLRLEVAAGAILSSERGTLGDQLVSREPPPLTLPHLDATRAPTVVETAPSLRRPSDLLFDNGRGGFSADGREYVIHLEPGESTPAPWCNVLANDDFGCLVTERGGGYTWAGNSGEFRLTPWTNDPVLDPAGESLYLRDEETVEVWSPTPGPAGSDRTCQVRHGAGYTEWRQNGRGLACRMRVFVPVDDPVKIVELSIRNHDARPRRITATYSARWLLGRFFEENASPVVVEYDAASRSLRGRNPWNSDFAEQVAFLSADRDPHGWTTDRTEFLGREGDASAPAALGRVGLNEVAGARMDPCAALQVHLDLAPGEEARTHFVLGAGADATHAEALVERWRSHGAVDAAWQALAGHWDHLLSAVNVRTPEPAMDLLLNRWSLYQVLSSRIQGRTGFYQSSGAIGFRDQLQDVLALLHTDPGRTREHILECARHQFEEGDVLHWWHPPQGRGVRTRCSDDLLWLPYAAASYIEATGDETLLDEEMPFLEAPPLAADEHDRYALFDQLGSSASLFEHCRRALERGLTRGVHGLPLIGDSDWNDGMNRVGPEGRGESVWLGWFTGATLRAFADLCDRRGEIESAKSWRDRAEKIFEATRNTGWDGEWYMRAFDDEGRPWGSSKSNECRIDSIAQSWAVLSGGAPPERAEQALESAHRMLVRRDEQIVRLLWPPFDVTPRDPGYIKAYPPGIRENGGQYSHAAAWLGWAFAEAGAGDRAMQIFRMLNPIERTRSATAIERYRLEPYALAGDIASAEPHTGRGGWSWYTGAAAWCWRLGVEAILGIRRVDGGLQIRPCMPPHWPGFEASIRTAEGFLEIEVRRGDDAGAVEIFVNGSKIDGHVVPMPISDPGSPGAPEATGVES